MTLQHLKRRPLSRHLKDFKHSQTHCAHCSKLLDRITLVRCGQIVHKSALTRLDTLMDDGEWAIERNKWTALCRFCGDLHCKSSSDFFDIIGFKKYLLEHTEMSPGTVREYIVRLRRLGAHLVEQKVDSALLAGAPEDNLAPWLPATSTNNYRIALRKYSRFQAMMAAQGSRRSAQPTASELY